jgi:hypothetical protein
LLYLKREGLERRARARRTLQVFQVGGRENAKAGKRGGRFAEGTHCCSYLGSTPRQKREEWLMLLRSAWLRLLMGWEGSGRGPRRAFLSTLCEDFFFFFFFFRWRRNDFGQTSAIKKQPIRDKAPMSASKVAVVRLCLRLRPRSCCHCALPAAR